MQRILELGLTLGLVLATITPALGDGITDPVDRILKVAEARWASMESEAPDYFDHIDRDFSKRFGEIYMEASKYPAYDEGTSPFDYDVITSSQDGCPLKDITTSPQGDKDGVGTVEASFKLWTCAPDAESQARVSRLKFDIVTEDGKAVIDDVHRFNEDKWDSLRAEMEEIVRLGKQQQP